MAHAWAAAQNRRRGPCGLRGGILAPLAKTRVAWMDFPGPFRMKFPTYLAWIFSGVPRKKFVSPPGNSGNLHRRRGFCRVVRGGAYCPLHLAIFRTCAAIRLYFPMLPAHFSGKHQHVTDLLGDIYKFSIANIEAGWGRFPGKVYPPLMERSSETAGPVVGKCRVPL